MPEETFKKIGDKLEGIQKEIDFLYDRIDNVCADTTYQEILEEFSEYDYDKKLKKKEKEEKRQKTIELMKNKTLTGMIRCLLHIYYLFVVFIVMLLVYYLFSGRDWNNSFREIEEKLKVNSTWWDG